MDARHARDDCATLHRAGSTDAMRWRNRLVVFVVRRWSSRRHKFPWNDRRDKRLGIATLHERLSVRHLSKATLDLIRKGMIATCYDSFIISRRVIPWNPVPQFILGATYVPLYPTSRRIITNVASEPYEEVRVDADAAFSRYIYIYIYIYMYYASVWRSATIFFQASP